MDDRRLEIVEILRAAGSQRGGAAAEAIAMRLFRRAWPDLARPTGTEGPGAFPAPVLEELRAANPVVACIASGLWQARAPQLDGVRLGLAVAGPAIAASRRARSAVVAVTFFAVGQAILDAVVDVAEGGEPGSVVLALLVADFALAECLVALAGLPLEDGRALAEAFASATEASVGRSRGSQAPVGEQEEQFLRMEVGARLAALLRSGQDGPESPLAAPTAARTEAVS